MELTVGTVAKSLGVPLETLKRFCEQGKIAGRKTPQGHWYMDAAAPISRESVRQLVADEYLEALQGVREAVKVLHMELEALGNDCDLAIEQHEYAPEQAPKSLGNDLRSAFDRDSAADSAMRRVRQLSHEAYWSHRELRQIHGERL